MIGKLNPHSHSVTIVGAGISGLLAAYFLSRKGLTVSLYESEPRCGGLIQTSLLPEGLAESAAHSFLNTPAVDRLCSELGVELLSVNKNSRARFIWRNNQLRRIPLHPIEIIQTAYRWCTSKPIVDTSRATLEDWAKKRLGHAALEFGLNPFLRGIYAARPSELSLNAVFPQNRKRASGRMVAPKLGMGEFVSKLEAAIRRSPNAQINTNQRISAAEIPAGENIVLCLPATAAAQWIGNEGQCLNQVQYAPLISATIFGKLSNFGKKISGVGVLIPEIEHDRKCLGILFNSSAFQGRTTQSDQLSLSMILGGTSRPELLTLSDQELEKIILEELEQILNLSRKNEIKIKLHKWPAAIPIYNNTLRETWTKAQDTWCSKPGHLLFGNYTGEISIRGMIETMDSKFR